MTATGARCGAHNSSGKGGAAYTITEECERLFCETLKAVFLGEGNVACQDSLGMGVQNNISHHHHHNTPHASEMELRLRAVAVAQGSTPPDVWSVDSGPEAPLRSFVLNWIEVWDYVSNARFRGFTAIDKVGVATLFVFFDVSVVGKDMKQGLMALLELASAPGLGCSQLVVGIGRQEISSADGTTLLRNLGWVGFEPITLDQWSGQSNLISTGWLFLGIEV